MRHRHSGSGYSENSSSWRIDRTTDDEELRTRLEALEVHDRESEEARAAAYDEIDTLLNVRQQVRFRVFEQAMERRRLDLLMRVRRPVQRRPGPQPR